MTEKKGFKRTMRDLGATVLVGSHLMNSPVGGLAMKAHEAMFPDPWKELHPYLTKHPVSGKLVIDEDKLNEKEKKKVYELLDKMQAKYTAKE